MEHPTGTPAPPQPPHLLGYETWIDEQGCYRARLRLLLPPAARDAGCIESIWADSALELTQKAVHNRVKIWTWESGQ